MKLYLDANIIIFGHEAEDVLRQRVLARLAEWCSHSEGRMVTSALSRLECLPIPLRNQQNALLAEYSAFFDGGEVEIVDVSLPVIDLATRLRAAHGFKSPDAIHLASALHAGAERFFTADARLSRCPDIQIEVLPIPNRQNS